LFVHIFISSNCKSTVNCKTNFSLIAFAVSPFILEDVFCINIGNRINTFVSKMSPRTSNLVRPQTKCVHEIFMFYSTLIPCMVLIFELFMHQKVVLRYYQLVTLEYQINKVPCLIIRPVKHQATSFISCHLVYYKSRIQIVRTTLLKKYSPTNTTKNGLIVFIMKAMIAPKRT